MILKDKRGAGLLWGFLQTHLHLPAVTRVHLSRAWITLNTALHTLVVMAGPYLAWTTSLSHLSTRVFNAQTLGVSWLLEQEEVTQKGVTWRKRAWNNVWIAREILATAPVAGRAPGSGV